MDEHERIHTKKHTAAHNVTKGSSEWNVLDEHERIHTEEKPYSCSQCDKRSERINDLNEHERIHTGEKPYSYFQCDQMFRAKEGLGWAWKNTYRRKTITAVHNVTKSL